MCPAMVRVDPNASGDWEIALPDQSGRLTCETVDEASRVGYLCATRRRPCELVVCDADHHVLYQDLIDDDMHGLADTSRVRLVAPETAR
jgi:hypothetical protein